MVELAERVYPDWQPEARELLALDQYLDQLSPEQMSLHVRQQHPKTINEAVIKTWEFEYLLLSINQSAMLCKHPNNLSTGSISKCHKDVVMEMLQNITDHVGKLEMAEAEANLTGTE